MKSVADGISVSYVLQSVPADLRTECTHFQTISLFREHDGVPMSTGTYRPPTVEEITLFQSVVWKTMPKYAIKKMHNIMAKRREGKWFVFNPVTVGGIQEA